MKQSTKKRLQSEKKRLSYTARLYLSYAFAAIILVMTINLIVKNKGFPNSNWFAADEATWIAFYGTLIGGFITLLGVNQTIRFTQEEDERLKEIEDEEKQKEEDLKLIRHLWELETKYHELSRTLHLTITKLDNLHDPTINELEEVFVFFQENLTEHDFLTLSARIDWETYDKVNQRLRNLRKLFIQTESDLLENRDVEDREMLKLQLTRRLREEKIAVDEVDELFERKRATLEERHLEKI